MQDDPIDAHLILKTLNDIVIRPRKHVHSNLIEPKPIDALTEFNSISIRFIPIKVDSIRSRGEQPVSPPEFVPLDQLNLS